MLFTKILGLIAGFVGVASSTAVNRDLSRLDWTLTNANGSISVPGKVPSQVHLDLFAANKIPDPLKDTNDYALRWILDTNWTYSATLDSPSTNKSTWLLFQGLDTFANIALCGQHVASTNNQFRQYHFDVTRLLANCTGPKDLNITFSSPTIVANSIAAQPGQETWPNGTEIVQVFPNRQFIRKQQNDFGWDWGPAFAPSGVWLPASIIQLEASDIFIRNSLVDIYRQGQIPLLAPDQSKPWVLNASIDYIGSLDSQATVDYDLFDFITNKRVVNGSLGNITRRANTITGSTGIDSNTVKLWWPHNLGNSTLYNLRLVVRSNGNVVSSVIKQVGFRTILLNQEPIRPDQLAKGVAPGANWHFEINGREFFAKGSNLIPPDVFWPRVNETRIKTLFNAAKKGNQNMLRVWASGAYLPDYVYNVADELGILLWSEFEFSDALYPVDKGFLDNVREEANYQVRRINHHPSLALWAGGNELENLELGKLFLNYPNQTARYVGEFERLFLDVLAPAVFENSKSISYTPTSSGNGWSRLDFNKSQPIVERYYNITPGEIYGNTDYYNYDSAQAFNISTYPIGRFSNEFGFQSMPSPQTWRAALSNPADLVFNSQPIELRNHHYPPLGPTPNTLLSEVGLAEMVTAARRWLPTPDLATLNTTAAFASWTRLTQIFQAQFYAAQIAFYRRGAGLPQRTLGSLYWQLEDQWAAPTWSGIEHTGRWKTLHYRARDLYRAVIVSPFYAAETDVLQMWVSSDLLADARGFAEIAWYDWTGQPLAAVEPHHARYEVAVGALNSTNVANWTVAQTVAPHNLSDVVVRLNVTVTAPRTNDSAASTFTHTAWFHPAPLSHAALVDPQLQYEVDTARRQVAVRATAGVAAWVWLDTPEGAVVQFEDNGFFLQPGDPATLAYEVESDETGGKWTEGLTVQSIWDLAL